MTRNYQRYQRIERWARNRYTRAGECLRSKAGQASRHCVIETLAAEKYLQCSRRTRNRRLAYPPIFQAPAF